MRKYCFFLLFLFIFDNSFAEQKERQNYYHDFLIRPLDNRNQYFLYLPHLFMPMEKAKTMPEKAQDIKIAILKASSFMDYFSLKERGVFDFETTIIQAQYAFPIFPKTEIRFSLPFIYYGSGYLDSTIENFHEAFGLPNGGREYHPTNRFELYFEDIQGNLIFEKKSPFYGLGDFSIYLKQEIFSANPILALSGAIKIPLYGGEWISSETLDLGLGIHFEYYGNIGYFYASAGTVFFLGKGYYKKELSKDPYSIFWGSGLGFRFSDSLATFVQLYFQTSPYHTGIKRIDRISTINSFGLRWIWQDFLIQFSFDEDSFTFTHPDITFNLQVEYRFF